MNETEITQKLRDALKARESMIQDLCRKGVATRTQNGVNVFDTHPLRLRSWKAVDSAYWEALQSAADAKLVTLHNYTFSWNQ